MILLWSMDGGDASADPHSHGFGWEPRSMPLAAQLTGTLSALLDDQLQQWTMSNTEMDNTLQQRHFLCTAPTRAARSHQPKRQYYFHI